MKTRLRNDEKLGKGSIDPASYRTSIVAQSWKAGDAVVADTTGRSRRFCGDTIADRPSVDTAPHLDDLSAELMPQSYGRDKGPSGPV
jgi:hypothetical protein